MEGLRKTTKNCQDSRCLSWDLNQTPSIYKSTVSALCQPVQFFITNFHLKCSILWSQHVLHPTSNTIQGLLYVEFTDIKAVLSEPVNLNDKKHGADHFSARVLWVRIVLSVACSDGCAVHEGDMMNMFHLQNYWHQPVSGGIKERKTAKLSRSVPLWGPPPWPNLIKYTREITLQHIIGNYGKLDKTSTKLEYSFSKSPRCPAQEIGIYSSKFAVSKKELQRVKEIVLRTYDEFVHNRNHFWHLLWSGWVLFTCWPMCLSNALWVCTYEVTAHVRNLSLFHWDGWMICGILSNNLLYKKSVNNCIYTECYK
jgi:hypothetical protein